MNNNTKKFDIESVIHTDFAHQENQPTERHIPLMLGIIQTAERYGLSQHYVRKLLLSGTVKGVRIGRGKLLCNCDDLERYLSESYVNESEPAPRSGIQPIAANL